MTTYLAIGIDYYNNATWQVYVSFREPQAIADLLYKQEDQEPDEIILLANGTAGPDVIGKFLKDEDYTFNEEEDDY